VRGWDTMFGSHHRIEAFSLLTSRVGCGTISSEGRDIREAYTRSRQGATRLWRGETDFKFIIEVGQMFSASPESGHMHTCCRLFGMH